MVGSSLIETKEVSVFEGDLPCLLVYSDPKHVNYINEVLSVAEDSIRKHGFKPERLSGEIMSDEDYYFKISSLLDSSALVLVILDGLRPNLVFEFGFAKAKNKPIIIIRSRGSVISVKTLYKALEHSGLTDVEFKKLKEPILDPNTHLSDFAGKHVAVIDRTAKETEDDHLSVILKKELGDRLSKILEEIQNVKTKDIDPNVLNEALPHLTKIIRLYYTEVEFEVQDLKTAVDEIYRISANHQQQLPKEIVSMAGSALTRLGNLQMDRKDTELAIQTFKAATDVYDKLLGVI